MLCAFDKSRAVRSWIPAFARMTFDGYRAVHAVTECIQTLRKASIPLIGITKIRWVMQLPNEGESRYELTHADHEVQSYISAYRTRVYQLIIDVLRLSE